MPRKRRSHKRKFNKVMQKKLVMLFVAVILAFVFLVGRITYINAASGDKYTKVVLDQQQYDSRTIPFKRGDILDRNGTKLATSERIYNVILDMKVMLSKKEYIEPTKKALVDCFGIEEEEIETLMEENPSGRYNVLKKGVDYTTAQKFRKMDKDDQKYPYVKGIWLEEDYLRKYPYKTLASDVLGFTVDGNVGSNGIEASYNSILNGTDGREYGYQDESASFERTVKEPENGKNIVTTIDLQVQSVVEKHIRKFNKEHKNQARKGEGSLDTAVIVMNPQNGEILAEASYPDYDLNHPRERAKDYSDEDLDKLILSDLQEDKAYKKYKLKTIKDLDECLTTEERDKKRSAKRLEILNNLWNNFCVSDTYEPGSTFKPFTLAAGFELGDLKGNEDYNCGGYLHVGDHDIHCVNRSGHGHLTLKQSLESSCNVAMMHIGKKIGKEEFSRYQSLFGFGELTGIDLPGEASAEGLLYTPENMDSASLATNSFGQNFNVTMTQLAAGFCSLINGGNYYRPHVVKQIQDESGNVSESKDPVLVRKTVSEETSKIIKDYMLGVVEEGTGASAAVEGYDVGGKTGTAEKHPRGQGKYLVSFIGYAPQENPQVVVYVVVNEPNAAAQANSGFATQIASDIMEEIFPYLGVEKVDSEKE